MIRDWVKNLAKAINENTDYSKSGLVINNYTICPLPKFEGIKENRLNIQSDDYKQSSINLSEAEYAILEDAYKDWCNRGQEDLTLSFLKSFTDVSGS